MYDILAFTFAAAMLWLWWYPKLHTGVVGSFGCIVLAGAAVMSTDDSLLSSVSNIEFALSGFMVGSLLLLVHVVARMAKADSSKPRDPKNAHRRGTDWQTFDDAPHHHSELGGAQ